MLTGKKYPMEKSQLFVNLWHNCLACVGRQEASTLSFRDGIQGKLGPLNSKASPTSLSSVAVRARSPESPASLDRGTARE